MENEMEAGTKPKGKKLTPEAAKMWLSRIQGRRTQFSKGWWKAAKKAQDMYNMEENHENSALANPFNILYANTEVLLPALYSNTPRPDVRSRFSDKQDPIAQACENLLTVCVDDNLLGSSTFDGGMELATVGALVPGMGFVRLRYYRNASCPFQYETGAYDELIWGHAASWPRVPWVSFEHKMTKEQIIEEFGLNEEEAQELKVISQQEMDTNESTKWEDDHTCMVHELWIKESRKVVFLCEAYEDIILDELDDVMKLEGFFPTPGPLTLITKSKTLIPTPAYEYYRAQAEELNRVSGRLKAVLSAIKVRGAYNNLIGQDLATLLSDDSMDNRLIPSTQPMDLMSKGFDGHIWLLPIEDLITVARELYSARQQILQVIYQITGIADIVRGASAASESATAQNIKDKWSGVRLRKSQKKVGNYARDLLRLTIDAASELLPEEGWKNLTQLPFPTTQEKQQAIAVLSQLEKMQSMMPQPQMVPGMPPPPQPLQPPPEMVKAAQSPSWGELLATLKNDKARVYSIDIETYSTIDPDAQIDKEDVSEFMGAMGQFIAGAAPLVQMQNGTEVAKELLLSIAGKYKFGRSVQAALKKLGPPAPAEKEGEKAQAPDHSVEVAQIRAQTDIQRTQMQTQSQEKVAKLEAQIDIMLAQMKQQSEQMKTQADQMKQMMQIKGQQQLSAQNAQQGMQQEAIATNRQAAIADRQGDKAHKQQMERDKFAAKNRPKPAQSGRK